jgi:hypothetical protein
MGSKFLRWDEQADKGTDMTQIIVFFAILQSRIKMFVSFGKNYKSTLNYYLQHKSTFCYFNGVSII